MCRQDHYPVRAEGGDFTLAADSVKLELRYRCATIRSPTLGSTN
jgi:hypothetical protein